MISVPSHRLPLSGNRHILVLLVIIFIYSCTSQKQAIDKSASTQDRKEDQTKDLVEQYDPMTDEVILVPRDEIEVDTIVWKKDDTPPIVTDEDIKKKKPTADDPVEIALLMPFNAGQAQLFSDHQDPRLNRFLHYYAGMRLAIDDIESSHLPIKIRSYDAEASTNSFALLSKNEAIQNADIIVGPYKTTDIEAFAEFGRTNEKMIISPWRPTFRTEVENPFLLQLTPGLNAHAEAITDFIHAQYPEEKVFVVGRDTEAERSRLKLFTETDLQPFEELVVTDTTPDLLETDLFILMDTLTTTVFILPYYSRSDETFVNDFMRKLHADKKDREVVVFGLPQWVGFTNLNPNYMERLNLHLSVSSFVDVNHQSYARFRTKFFNRYHIIPDLNAFMGYDFMRWMANAVSEDGQEGLINQMHATDYGLASGYDMHPVFQDSVEVKTEMNVPLYYENRSIRMLLFIEQDFTLIY